MRGGSGRWWGAVWLAGALGVAGCSLVREPTPPPVIDGVQVGVASWYGPGFHGNRTANGEIYDQYDLTAAHPSLPHGTRAMVTNLTNGRSVEVRINDRGPFVAGRAIDLSYAAARAIDMIRPGIVRVRIEILGRAAAPSRPLVPPPPQDLPTGAYLVEIASLTDPAKARRLREVLAQRFPEVFVTEIEGAGGSYYRVRIGPYPLRTAAVARAELVTRLGYPAIIIDGTP